MFFKKMLAVALGCSLLSTAFVQSSSALDLRGELGTEQKIYSKLSAADDFLPGKVFVVMKKDRSIDLSKQALTAQDFNGVKSGEIKDISALPEGCDDSLVNKENYHQIISIELPGADKQETLDAIQKIEQNESVLSVAADTEIWLDDPIEDDQGDASVDTQYGLANIDVSVPWANATTGSRSVKVGVIDSGIESSHSGLSNNVNTALSKNFTDDGQGLTDTVGHGTHVAGIIGANGSFSELSGVCKQVTLVSLRVFKNENGKGKGKGEWLANAINYAQSNGIGILNYSGSGPENSAVQAALNNYAGMLITSAGNDSANIDSNKTNHFPAGYTNSNVIAVASVNKYDTLASSSNYGSTSIDLAAPGVKILSTYLGNSQMIMGGTSMAAPFVTGTVALLKAYYPNLTNTQIRACILSGVKQVSGLSGKVATGGVLNAANAFKIALGLSTSAHKLISGDFNGDGKDDLMSIATIGYTHTRFMVSTSTGYEYNEWKAWMDSDGIMPSCYGDRIGAGDVNGDGKDDIVTMYRYPDGSVKLFVYLSEGNGFTGTNIWGSWKAGDYDANCVGSRFTVGDYNGDGKDDMAVMYSYPDGSTKIFTYISTGSSFGGSQAWASWPAGAYNASCVDDRFVSGDFNGDGKDDIALMYRHGSMPAQVNLYTYLSTGSSFNGSLNFRQWPSGAYSTNCVGGRFTVGDFNNDGKDDIGVLYFANNQSKIFAYLSTGSAFTVNTWKTWGTGAYNGNCIGDHFVGGDFNGDGYDDVVSIYRYPNHSICAFEQNSTGSAFADYYKWW